MKSLREKVSYLKGLADGLKLDENTNEGKLLKAIIDVLDDFAQAVDDVVEFQNEMSDQIDAIDQDLEDVERVIFSDEYDDDGSCNVTIKCPECNEEFEIDVCSLDDEDEVECPHCGEKFDVDIECTCGDKDIDEKEDK
ncbi:MAG TPA: hypothetical protein GXX49_09270 [Clostridiaceae bacterium]|jgi:DNA-directed RNA polymerase subunit RPC12/RpoP|nr:hypothetical protein [Clostridiaceae bacterium]